MLESPPIDFHKESYIKWINLLHEKLSNLNINKPINIDFDRIPIINYNNNEINITYDYKNYIFTEYFKNLKNTRFSYFVYSLIVNLSMEDYKSYGGIIRYFINNTEEMNDLDFSYYRNKNDIHTFDFRNFCSRLSLYNKPNLLNILGETHYYNKNNIDFIINILHNIIFNYNIKSESLIMYEFDLFFDKTNIRLIYDKLNIDVTINKDYYNERKENKYDFYENMLYLDYIKCPNPANNFFVIKSYKEYDYNEQLVFILISSFISNKEICNNYNLLQIILEMIGNNYACVLEALYYISKKKLRLTHDNCFDGTTRINLSKNKIINNFNIDKIIYYRIPKFQKKNYKIIYDNKCSKYNCICYITELKKKYNCGKYTVDFVTFAEKYYNETHLRCPLVRDEKYFHKYSMECSSFIILLENYNEDTLNYDKLNYNNYDKIEFDKYYCKKIKRNNKKLLINENKQLLINENKQLLINKNKQLLINENKQLLINEKKQLLINEKKQLLINENKQLLINEKKQLSKRNTKYRLYDRFTKYSFN